MKLQLYGQCLELYFQSPGYEKIVDQGVLYDLSDLYTKQLDAENALHYVSGLKDGLAMNGACGWKDIIKVLMI